MDKKNTINKIISFFTAVNIFISGISIGSFFLAKRAKFAESPYTGCEINIDDNMLERKVKDVLSTIYDDKNDAEISDIYDTLSEKDKKDFLILYSLKKNFFFDDDNVRDFSGYINYLRDNKYLNYEDVYKTFKTNVMIKKNDLGIASGKYYDDYNLIFYNDKRSIIHELFHADDIYFDYHIYNDKVQRWFTEGCAELLSSEYCDNYISSYPAECSAIRLLSSFVGSDIIFKARSTKDFECLPNELISLGASSETIDKLFDLLNEHLNLRSAYRLDMTDDEISIVFNKMLDLRIDIADCFVDLYNEINYLNNSYTDPLFIENIDLLLKDETLDLNKNKFNIFNKRDSSYNSGMCNAVKKCKENIEYNGVKYTNMDVTKYYYKDEVITKCIILGNMYERKEQYPRDYIDIYKKEYLKDYLSLKDDSSYLK